MQANGASLEKPRVPTRVRFASRTPVIDPGRLSTALLVTLAVIAFALGVATYGVGTNRKTIALIGLFVTAVMAAALVVIASDSIRSRDVLLAANEDLQRRDADLDALHLAVLDGLDVIDERTQGRLLELIEETGDELAELVDELFDEGDGDT